MSARLSATMWPSGSTVIRSGCSDGRISQRDDLGMLLDGGRRAYSSFQIQKPLNTSVLVGDTVLSDQTGVRPEAHTDPAVAGGPFSNAAMASHQSGRSYRRPAALPLVGERVEEMRPIGGKRAISSQAFQGLGRRATR